MATEVIKATEKATEAIKAENLTGTSNKETTTEMNQSTAIIVETKGIFIVTVARKEMIYDRVKDSTGQEQNNQPKDREKVSHVSRGH